MWELPRTWKGCILEGSSKLIRLGKKEYSVEAGRRLFPPICAKNIEV
jgi:hypothetical protein